MHVKNVFRLLKLTLETTTPVPVSRHPTRHINGSVANSAKDGTRMTGNLTRDWASAVAPSPVCPVC